MAQKARLAPSGSFAASQRAFTKNYLKPRFYQRETLQVARDLLGQVLCVKSESGFAAGRIVETEAYLGELDPASHAFRGPTPRSSIMFGPGGYAYVYFSYGFHHCFNVVAHTPKSNTAGAVLIRALEPVAGIAIMRARRKREAVTDLCSGPGKLAQALGIDLSFNTLSLKPNTSQAAEIWIAQGISPKKIAASPRIGIRLATDKAWRFTEVGSPYLSRKV